MPATARRPLRAAAATTLAALLGALSGCDPATDILPGTPPAIDLITPAWLAPGELAAIHGSGFAGVAEGNSVVVDGTPAQVTAATASRIDFRVPDASAAPCTAERSVTLTVSIADAATDAQHPLRPATPVDLAPGTWTDLDGHALRCFSIEHRDDAAYAIAVVHAGDTLSATTSFELRFPGAGARTTTPAAPASRASAESRTGAAGHHARIIQHGWSILERVAASSLATARRARPARAAAAGDTLRLRVPDRDDDFCNAYSEVDARVVRVGERITLLEDVAAPLAGELDDLFINAALDFDARVYPLVRSYFGDPLAMDSATDGDGRVYLLVTPVLNGFPGALGAFVWGGDLIPATASGCASSNLAEVIYMWAPEFHGAGTRGSDHWRDVPSFLVHETKHLASAAVRIAGGASRYEDWWLEEATARIAEELWARTHFGYGQHGNTSHAESLYCEARPHLEECAGSPWVMMNGFIGLYDYLVDGETLSPLGPARDGDATFYSSGWSIVRWLLDHYGGTEADLLRTLTAETTRGGIESLVANTGFDWPGILARWAVALATDDESDFIPSDPTITFPSWDLRDIFAGLHSDFPDRHDRAYPLAPRSLTYDSPPVQVHDLRAGSAAQFRLRGTAAGAQLVEIRDPATGGAPSDALVLAVVRLGVQ